MQLIPRIFADSALGYSWTCDPLIISGLITALFFYAWGLAQSRQISQRSTISIICFLLGWFTLVIALVSPLHELGEFLFAAHMAQHELLMAVAAPLLMIGRPDIIYLWALPREWRKGLSRLQHLPFIHKILRMLFLPLVAWLLHAVVLWGWHIPALFNAAVTRNWVHAFQHISFLGSALLFWGVLLYGRVGRRGYGEAILYVFTTAVHTSVLGALLTFAGSPWYPVYTHTTRLFGFTPLEDQQVGGLIMWVPVGLVYIIVGLWLLAGWIQDSDRRTSFGRVEARYVA